jgi:hypothetical protein
MKDFRGYPSTDALFAAPFLLFTNGILTRIGGATDPLIAADRGENYTNSNVNKEYHLFVTARDATHEAT